MRVVLEPNSQSICSIKDGIDVFTHNGQRSVREPETKRLVSSGSSLCTQKHCRFDAQEQVSFLWNEEEHQNTDQTKCQCGCLFSVMRARILIGEFRDLGEG